MNLVWMGRTGKDREIRERKCSCGGLYAWTSLQGRFSYKCKQLTASNYWHFWVCSSDFVLKQHWSRRQSSVTTAHSRDLRACSFLPKAGLLQWPSLSQELLFGFSKTLSHLHCIAPSCLPDFSFHRCGLCIGLGIPSLLNPVPPPFCLLQALYLHSTGLLHF